MNEKEKKIILMKENLRCKLNATKREVDWIKERINFSEKEKKNHENYLGTLENELEKIKSEIPNFSEDIYKQYKKYFDTEMKINNAAKEEEDKIKYLKEKLENLVFEQKCIMAELEKIDNNIELNTK